MELVRSDAVLAKLSGEYPSAQPGNGSQSTSPTRTTTSPIESPSTQKSLTPHSSLRVSHFLLARGWKLQAAPSNLDSLKDSHSTQECTWPSNFPPPIVLGPNPNRDLDATQPPGRNQTQLNTHFAETHILPKKSLPLWEAMAMRSAGARQGSDRQPGPARRMTPMEQMKKDLVEDSKRDSGLVRPVDGMIFILDPCRSCEPWNKKRWACRSPIAGFCLRATLMLRGQSVFVRVGSVGTLRFHPSFVVIRPYFFKGRQ